MVLLLPASAILGRSDKNALDHLAADVRQPEMTSLVLEREPGVIDSQAIKNRCLQIVDVNRVAGHIVTVVVSLAMSDARLDAAAGGPHGKATRMMITSI